MEVLVNRKQLNSPHYRDIYKQYQKLQKLIKQQIKEVSIERENCMQIPYKWKEVNLRLYRDIHKKNEKLSKMFECQIKEVSI